MSRDTMIDDFDARFCGTTCITKPRKFSRVSTLSAFPSTWLKSTKHSPLASWLRLQNRLFPNAPDPGDELMDVAKVAAFHKLISVLVSAEPRSASPHHL